MVVISVSLPVGVGEVQNPVVVAKEGGWLTNLFHVPWDDKSEWSE